MGRFDGCHHLCLGHDFAVKVMNHYYFSYTLYMFPVYFYITFYFLEIFLTLMYTHDIYH